MALHVFQQMLEREVCQRTDQEVGMRERELARQRIRHGDAKQPGAFGSGDAIGRIFQGDGLRRLQRKRLHHRLIERRVRLSPVGRHRGI